MTLCIAAKKITKRKIEVVNYRAGLFTGTEKRRESGETSASSKILNPEWLEFDRRRKR
jgi:hypothetical protein